MTSYTPGQMMSVALAHQIEDGKTYIIGTGLPLRGAVLAKMTHAPEARFIFETAIFDGAPVELPTSVSDLRIAAKASVLWPQYRYFGFQTISAQRGGIAAGFLGGAQIDPYGNLNSTCIGDYNRPETRFSGSGGANGIATYCNTVIVMKHQKRRFVERVDYVTSPGWIDGMSGRAAAGLSPNIGPLAVVTELGIMRFDDTTKRMYLSELFPEVDIDTIVANTGFEIDCSRYTVCRPPTERELEALSKI